MPSHKRDRQDGAFYLESVDALGVRQYAQHVGGLFVDRDPDSIVTRIELLQDTLDDKVIQCIIDALEPGRIHIFSSACEHFCVGASASGAIDLGDFTDGLSDYARLHDALGEICDLPTVVLCHGATRGGGMIFPSAANIVLATPDATFGFPEIRRGVLPGVVSGSDLDGEGKGGKRWARVSHQM